MRLLKALTWMTLAVVAGAAFAEPTVVSAFGKVEIGHGAPPVWREARSGEALAPGDSVRTAAGARAELQLGDKRIVRVYEQSLLRLGTGVTPTGAVRSMELEQGQSIFDVMKKMVTDEFDVITPEVVVSVKGTRFLVAAVEGEDYTSCFRGEVGIKGDGFEAVAVRPGMTGAHGELFATGYPDPWTAWESDATPPARAIDESQVHEVSAAIQAALSVTGTSSSGGDSDGNSSGSGSDDGLLGGLLAGLLGSSGNSSPSGDASPAASSDSSGDLAVVAGAVGEVTNLLGGDDGAVGSVVGGTTELVGGLVGSVTDPIGQVLTPVSDPVGSLLTPLTDPLGGALAPVLGDPMGSSSVLTPVGGLLGGVLGSPRSP